MDQKFFTQNFEEKEETLPEPRKVKREILNSRTKAKSAKLEFGDRTNPRNFRDFKKAVINFYDDLRVYAEKMGVRRKELEDIQERLFQDEELTKENAMDWVRKYNALDDITHEMGIKKIGLSEKNYEFGYEFLEGTPFEMSSENEGFRRLKMNVRNMKEKLRDDVDFFIVITGGNRTGKDTMALHLAPIGEDDFDEDNMVFTDGDFWDATNQEKYTSVHITELSDHFYSKNAMKGDQKKKKRKLKKFAKKNMIIFGCDLNFYNIDKEIINDKVTANIHIPERGKFEFYTRKQILEGFEKHPDTGETIRPSPAFTGRFPKLNNEVWETYKEFEDDKIQVEEEKEKGETITVQQIVEQIKERQEYFTKEWGDKQIVDRSLVEAEFSVGRTKAKQAKSMAEANLGIGK